jgi:hypothetical protein
MVKLKVKKNKGFALLFSVLLASLLLTIGLSIFSIALKELAISSASVRSIHAFYAADSGRECALYWDIKRGEIPNLFDNNKTTGNITCGSNSIHITVSGDYNAATVLDSTGVTTDIPITYVASGTDGPNFIVTVGKTIHDRDTSIQGVNAWVTVDGRDSASGNRVEREIREDY